MASAVILPSLLMKGRQDSEVETPTSELTRIPPSMRSKVYVLPCGATVSTLSMQSMLPLDAIASHCPGRLFFSRTLLRLT